jgi:hypothetical protein
VDLSKRVVRQIDEIVGPRKRSKFLEEAAIASLRRQTLTKWVELGERFKGLTPEDIYYPSREELEARSATSEV